MPGNHSFGDRPRKKGAKWHLSRSGGRSTNVMNVPLRKPLSAQTSPSAYASIAPDQRSRMYSLKGPALPNSADMEKATLVARRLRPGTTPGSLEQNCGISDPGRRGESAAQVLQTFR